MALSARNSVQLIEAAYRPASDDPIWLTGLLEAARPALDHGQGLFATITTSTSRGRRIDAQVGLGDLPSGWLRRLDEQTDAASQAGAHRLASLPAHGGGLPMPPVGTLTELVARVPGASALLGEQLARRGVGDLLGLVGRDPSGSEVFVGAPLPRATRLSRAETGLWSRVAAHLVAGLRFRRRPRAQTADAVLDAEGRVSHAEGEAQGGTARQALRDAAVAVDRASRALRTADPARAVSLWQALVDGRWSLTETFDSDGKRFLIATRNDPSAPGPRTLTRRERQILGYARLGHADKLIAYELGIAESTVSTHVSQAAAKLGVRSRAALIRRLATEANDATDGSEGEGEPA